MCTVSYTLYANIQRVLFRLVSVWFLCTVPRWWKEELMDVEESPLGMGGETWAEETWTETMTEGVGGVGEAWVQKKRRRGNCPDRAGSGEEGRRRKSLA